MMTQHHANQPGSRNRGIAMIIVMVFIAIGMVMSVSFLTVQSAASESAHNIEKQAKARAIAESGMAKSIAYIRNNPDWRAQMQPGEWARNNDANGGTFTVFGEDGVIDVVKSESEKLMRAAVTGDGDFKNNDSDPVTITVTGEYQGVKHIVQATLQPDVDDVEFIIEKGKVILQEPLEPEFVALGASISYGGRYDLPVTVQLTLDGKNLEPWGDFADPIKGNVNSDELGTSDETITFGNKLEFKASERFVGGKQIAHQVYLPKPTTVTQIAAWVKGPPSKHLIYGIYSDKNNEPHKLIAQTKASTVNKNKFHVEALNVEPTPLEPGNYWLTIAFEHDAMYYKYAEGKGQTRYKNNGEVFDDLDEGEAKLDRIWRKSDEELDRAIGIFAIGSENGGAKRFQEIPAGAEVTAKGRAWVKKRNNYSGDDANHWKMYMEVDSHAGSKNVQVLVNGDPVPNMKGINGQKPAEEFLKDFINPTTGRMKLKRNQAIFLFELGTRNTKSSAADFQDLVMLLNLHKPIPDSSEDDPAVRRRVAYRVTYAKRRFRRFSRR